MVRPLNRVSENLFSNHLRGVACSKAGDEHLQCLCVGIIPLAVHIYLDVYQLVDYLIWDEEVVGSSPTI